MFFKLPFCFDFYAEVAKWPNAAGLGPVLLVGSWVRILPSAFSFYIICLQYIEGFEYPSDITQNPQKSTLNSLENKGYSKSSIEISFCSNLLHR